MNVHSLKSLSIVRGLNQSDLARAAGVTRQTVSYWFALKDGGEINLYSKNLENLSRSLGISIERLSQRLPILGDLAERQKWETALLWDRLYPNLETFIAGIIRGQRQALARLVQVCGLYQSEKIAGKQVWKRFPIYKQFIHPIVRAQTEIIWKTAQSLKQS